MKPIRISMLQIACLAVFSAAPIYAEPSPSPTATPRVEPSPTATATPNNSPSPTATPHIEPSATATPTPTPRVEPSATPTPTPHVEPSPTSTPKVEPSPSASPSATPGGDDDKGGVSLRGLYEGTTSTGALAVFYFDNNKHIQIHVLDVAGNVIGFVEGAVTNGTFSLTLTTGQAISGTATDKGIAVTLAGQNFNAARVPTFGSDNSVAGRYTGVANGPTGESQVMFIIDTSDNMVMIQRTGTTLAGGYGKVTAPTATNTNYTFTLDHVVGSSSPITGLFTIVDGVFSGSFTTSAGTFTVNSFKSSLANRMANISTRGLIGPGQGQLIGGFIITGGPKTVLIRALGPSLAASGVSPAVSNPSLQLYSGNTLLGSNDDWKTNANVADIIASGIAPKDDLEAALLVRLEPGAYTTVVSGSDATPAIGLVEVYEAGSD